MIERPPHGYYIMTDEELFMIAVEAERQGGNKICAHKINQILDKVVERNGGSKTSGT